MPRFSPWSQTAAALTITRDSANMIPYTTATGNSESTLPVPIKSMNAVGDALGDPLSDTVGDTLAIATPRPPRTSLCTRLQIYVSAGARYPQRPDMKIAAQQTSAAPIELYAAPVIIAVLLALALGFTWRTVSQARKTK